MSLYSSYKNHRDKAAANAAQRDALHLKNQQIKQQNDIALKQAGYRYNDQGVLEAEEGGDAALQKAQNEATMQKLKAVETQLAVRESDERITDYLKTGDAESLQRALDNSEMLKELYKKQGVHLVANLDFENDEALLKRSGVDLSQIPDSNKDLARRSLFKYHDGQEWKVGATEMLVARTGLAKRVTGSQLDALNEFQAASAKAAKGITSEDAKVNREVKQKKATTDATKAQASLTQASASQASAEAAQTTADAKLLGEQTDAKHAAADAESRGKHAEAALLNAKRPRTGKTAVDKTKNPDGSFKPGYDEYGKQGETASNLARSEGVYKEMLDTHFGGDEQAFLSADLEDPKFKERNTEAVRAVNKIRRLAKVNIVGSDKRRLDELTKLTSLSRGASKLDNTDVGWFDDTMQQVSKYLTNEPEFLGNTEAKSSYAAFQGILRVAMIGAAQTTSEMRNFSKMLGSTKLQYRPLLNQLDTILRQVEDQYMMFDRTVGNRAVAKVLTGTNIATLQKSRARIAESLAAMDKANAKKKRTSASNKNYWLGRDTGTQPKRVGNHFKKSTSVVKRNPGESVADYLARRRGG